MIYKNLAGEIILDNCIGLLSFKALDTYMHYNCDTFYSGEDFQTFELFNDVCNLIDYKHNQKLHRTLIPLDISVYDKNYNKNVLLAFSGGLDSAYQAFVLKEQGYNVILFHVKNMNYYTNGKEFQVVNEFANKYQFDLIVAEFRQNSSKTNPYRKHWRENSFKNTLLYSMMVDYCLTNNIHFISSGDDLQLDIEDTVVGTNVSDARQITLAFMDNIKKTFGIEFIPIQKINNTLVHKGIRLQKLIDMDALDLFYSCVNPGRFNQSNHDRINKKFNIQLEKWNCGVCRKCAFHSLLLYYYLNKDYPKDFIDFCWNKISNGADYEFFKPSLPLDIRIKNLYVY